MRFRDYFKTILAGPSPLRLFLFQLLDVAPELRADVSIPTGFGKINRRHIFLFFGGPGSSPPTHYDVDLPNVFHTVIHGKRRIVLFGPEESRNLYQHPFTVRSYMDLEKPDYKTYPRLSNARGYECVLTPGQTLFIPSGYWHKVYYQTGGYAISYRQYVASRIPRGLYNLLIQESIDKLLNKLMPTRWSAWKHKRSMK
jgi:ribosomal protein L16 Arg81 hydroxylase